MPTTHTCLPHIPDSHQPSELLGYANLISMVFTHFQKCYDHSYIFSSPDYVFFESVFIDVWLVHNKQSNFFTYLGWSLYCAYILLCRHIDGYVNIYNIDMFNFIIMRNKWNCLNNVLFVCSSYVVIQHELCHSNIQNCCKIVHIWGVGNTLTTCKITVYSR